MSAVLEKKQIYSGVVVIGLTYKQRINNQKEKKKQKIHLIKHSYMALGNT